MSSKLNPILLAVGLLSFITACQDDQSDVKATNVVNGETVNYFYQTYTMTADPETDTFQKYAIDSGLTADDESERIIPRELQGLFFLDGAPFPDKMLSLKRAQPMDENANRIKWTVPSKTTFAWLNNEKGHHTLAKAISHDMQYELEWRDCPEEAIADMRVQFAKFGVEDQAPASCSAADRKFAVINAFATYEGERIGIPENVLYFDMYLIPKNDERDYYIWHRRSKICNNNEGSNIKGFCDVVKAATGKSSGDGYSRYQFTQVVTPEGTRTSKYNSSLLPEVVGPAGEKDNIFVVCDPSEVNGDSSCLDGTENLPPIKDREIPIEKVEEKELTFFEKLVRTRKIGQYMVKVAIDLTELMIDGKSKE